jgi:hypothetical protein
MELKQIMDPYTRHVFLSTDEYSYIFPIVHVEDSYLYFVSKESIADDFLEGHVTAQNDAGQVMFKQPKIESMLHQSEENVWVHRLNFSGMDYDISNRREYNRHTFEEPLSTVLKVFDVTMDAQIKNISEGGLRLRMDAMLKKEVFCQLNIMLPTDDAAEDRHVYFSTNGMVVYNDPGEDGIYTVGLAFVTPQFASEDEKNAYLDGKEALRRFIQRKQG